MKISTKGRYAVRALMYLAMNEAKGAPIPMHEIADDQDISVKYLELITRMLVSYGLIKSVKGKNGGLLLGKKADQIRFSDILEATEGPLSLVSCVDNPETCGRHKICYARDIWVDFSKVFYDHFNSVTLQDLVAKYCTRKTLEVK